MKLSEYGTELKILEKRFKEKYLSLPRVDYAFVIIVNDCEYERLKDIYLNTEFRRYREN